MALYCLISLGYRRFICGLPHPLALIIALSRQPPTRGCLGVISCSCPHILSAAARTAVFRAIDGQRREILAQIKLRIPWMDHGAMDCSHARTYFNKYSATKTTRAPARSRLGCPPWPSPLQPAWLFRATPKKRKPWRQRSYKSFPAQIFLHQPEQRSPRSSSTAQAFQLHPVSNGGFRNPTLRFNFVTPECFYRGPPDRWSPVNCE